MALQKSTSPGAVVVAKNTTQKDTIDSYLKKLVPSDIVNTSMSSLTNAKDVVKAKLKSMDGNKMLYAALFLGAIAFISKSVYTLLTMGLAVLVAAWSLKNLWV